MRDNNLASAFEAPVDVTERTAEEMEQIDAEYSSLEDENIDSETDVSEEEIPEDTDTSEEETIDNEEEPVEEEEVPETDPVDLEKEYQKKTRIHNNTILFLDLVRNSYESFNNKYNKSCEKERLKDFHTINKAFTDLIQSIENTLKSKFIDAEYTDMVKYYVSYNRIYDIIVRMVETFVIDNRNESKS